MDTGVQQAQASRMSAECGAVLGLGPIALSLSAGAAP